MSGALRYRWLTPRGVGAIALLELGLQTLAGEAAPELAEEQRARDLLDQITLIERLLAKDEDASGALQRASGLAPPGSDEAALVQRLDGEAQLRRCLRDLGELKARRAAGADELQGGEQLLTRARELVRLHSLAAFEERVHAAERDLEEQRRALLRRGAEEAILAAKQEAEEACQEGRFSEAEAALERADDRRRLAKLPDDPRLDELRALISNYKVSYADWRALAPVADDAPAPALEAGIKARQRYLEDHPRAFRRAAVEEELGALRGRLAERQSAAVAAEQRQLLAAGQKLLADGDLAGARAKLGEAVAHAERHGLDPAPARAALAEAQALAARRPVPVEKLRQLGFAQIGQSSVWISKSEVTNSEYTRFVIRQQRAQKDVRGLWPGHWQAVEGSWVRTYPNGESDLPVGGVSFVNARAYCAWWTEELRQGGDKKIGVLSNVTARLPTEAEWVAAAREGTQRAFPWGDAWDPRRVVWRPRGKEGGAMAARGAEAERLGGATPGGGVLHLAGNVAEWVDTVWDDEGKPDPSKRVLKGGSFRSFNQELLRIDHREAGPMATSQPHWGFRVVLELSE